MLRTKPRSPLSTVRFMKKAYVRGLLIAVLAAFSACSQPATTINSTPAPARFAGPSYNGAPDTKLMVAFLKAGGGANFSMQRAMAAMIGPVRASRERAALSKQFGAPALASYEKSWSLTLDDYGAASLWRRSSATPGLREGIALAAAVVRAGTDSSNTLYTGYLLDHLMSHAVAAQVIGRLGTQLKSARAVRDFMHLSDRQFYDLAHVVGIAGIRQPLSSWAVTSGMHIVPAQGGSVAYVYRGTGAPSANESAVLMVDVTPGRTYSFSAVVDPSQIVRGQFALFIDEAAGNATYLWFFGHAGKAGRYATALWVCPPGVRQVLLGMQILSATVKKDGRLTFSHPVLSEAHDGLGRSQLQL